MGELKQEVMAGHHGPCKLSKEERAEIFKRVTTDPRPFDPKLGDQAVLLLDKAITTFRNRRAAVMQMLADDEDCIKWAKHEIAWIDKKVKMLSDHKAKQSARLAVVTEQLTKWKAFPPEDDTSAEALDTLGRSVMPVLHIAKCGRKHAALNKIRTDNRYGRSMSEFERGFNLETKHRPSKTLQELEEMMNAPGTTRSDLTAAIRRLAHVKVPRAQSGGQE